jgi:hypothetical protein
VRSGAIQSHDENKKADEIIHEFTRDNQLTGTRKSRFFLLSPSTHTPLSPCPAPQAASLSLTASGTDRSRYLEPAVLLQVRSS